MSIRTFSLVTIFAVALVGAVNSASAQTPAGSGGEGIVGVVPRLRIAIESNDAAVAALARKAFNTHGDYDVATDAPTRLRFTKTGDTAVSLVFQTAGSQGTQSLTGATWQEATLRACDAALVFAKKLPFFSGQIAFVSDRTGKKEIYAGDLFLNAVRPLTGYGSITVNPRWTHDGTEVLHTTYANNNFTDIYAVNVATGRRRDVVVGARGTCSGAVANPRTGQIAFASSSRGNMDIYIADASGRSARTFIASPNVETDPAWSADGTRLAFSSGATGSPGIHIANVPGGTSKRVPTSFRYATEPAWNPVEPTKIAFTYQQSGFHLGVVDTATGKVEKIEINGSYTHPAWCADGRHLLATQISGSTSRIVLIDTKGNAGQKKKVTTLSGAQMANCSEADYRAVK